MGSNEFRNQYKTPDWQKKRLEALEHALPTGESILAATNQVRDFYLENDGELLITLNKQRHWWDKE